MSTEPVWPEGYEKVVFDSVDSTNAEALRAAPEIERPTWFMACRQEAGRGRRGRDWQMPDGNFAATLAMRPTGTAGWAALRSFMAALAVFETLALYTQRTRLSLKWPNDVLLDGGKVAGILLESASAPDGIDWLVIGIGVNLAAAPEGLEDDAFPPIALGGDIDPEDFLLRLAGHYATEESILEQLGFAPIREKWLRNAARLGEVITARTGSEEVTGIFETVDEAGRLVLATDHGERRIAAADVYF
ncbi:BirA family biotin operon repressor/biotin-[acetyl-CoA-carboxylase] ligase [Palleronia aestuarii]|uniref:biotin--[biotin carboxyl-carrier protein] ligase n=1 Tax=Palleronia aestuarii TaxID=568105 RepID=A0A2W7NDD4_9RHOB|nr:biotin--[acetyl-CoA-carboxylase] ligase [Palleronia aestuarii]PZX17623.1 BirA family biotin operon repressor/biotin-[acetyl-CoA-carboxylase] ligase [Palleronia aestuarii]